MTTMDAWHIISRNLHELYNRRNANGEKPYNDEEIEAEVMCFVALKEWNRRC